jgi:hypothetical protein
LPDFSWHNKPKREKMTTKYTKCKYNVPHGHIIPNGQKFTKYFPCPGPSRIYQNRHFWNANIHLATLTRGHSNFYQSLPRMQKAGLAETTACGPIK